MAANPIFPLYYNDIDRSTRDWTDEEFGCYMRLLMHQWAQGEIPKETQRLARIAPSVTHNWELLKAKFVETETGLINERLEEIREQRKSFLKKQSNNGIKGGRPSKKPKENPNNNPKKSLHNEYEYEEEKEDELKGGTGEKESFFINELPKDLQLTKVQICATEQFISIQAKKHLTDKEIQDGWEAFKIDNFSKKEWYATFEDLLSHFRRSLKYQTINGINSKPFATGTSKQSRNAESLNYLLNSLADDLQRNGGTID